MWSASQNGLPSAPTVPPAERDMALIGAAAGSGSLPQGKSRHLSSAPEQITAGAHPLRAVACDSTAQRAIA